MDSIFVGTRSAEQRRPKLSASTLTWMGRFAVVLIAHLSLVGVFWLVSEWRQSDDSVALNIELVTSGAEVLDAALIDAPENVTESSVDPSTVTPQSSAASAPTQPEVEPLTATSSPTEAPVSKPIALELNERLATDQELEPTDTVTATLESRPVAAAEPQPTPTPTLRPQPQPQPQPTPKPAPQPQPTTAKQAQSQQPRPATQPIAVAAAPMAAPDVGPKPTSSPKPPYPLTAFKAKQEGRVVLELEVLEDGAVGQVRLAQSSTVESLDESALATVKKWKYSPAQKGGQIVKQWIRVSILFEVKSR
jgi:protein TonB